LAQSEFTSEWLISNVDHLLAKSSASPLAGSPVDIEAASKIVALVERAVQGDK